MVQFDLNHSCSAWLLSHTADSLSYHGPCVNNDDCDDSSIDALMSFSLEVGQN